MHHGAWYGDLHGLEEDRIVSGCHRPLLAIRLALGAQRGDIVWLVLAQAVALVSIGLTIGIGVALVAGRRVQPLLFGESARDPAVFVGVVATVAVVAGPEAHADGGPATETINGHRGARIASDARHVG